MKQTPKAEDEGGDAWRLEPLGPGVLKNSVARSVGIWAHHMRKVSCRLKGGLDVLQQVLDVSTIFILPYHLIGGKKPTPVFSLHEHFFSAVLALCQALFWVIRIQQ